MAQENKQIFGIFNILFSFSGGEIHEGQDISDLKLNKDEEDELKVKDFKGKWLVLYFYPKDNTPGCTKEARTFSSMINEFHEQDAEVIGVSTDSGNSHREFKQKHNLKIRLLSDPDGKLAKQFGIKIIFGMCARDTVLINPEGKVEKIYKGVDPKASPGQIYEYIKDQNLIRVTKTS